MAPILSRVSSDFGFGRKRGAAVAIPASATGGNQTPSAGLAPGNGYKYHVFTSSGGFTFTRGNGSNDIEVLMVAGGGGGGYRHGGGGGAGQLINVIFSNFSPGPYPIVIGSGGAGGTPPQAPGNSGDGGDTTFNSYVAGGGGGGGPSYVESLGPNPRATRGSSGRLGTPTGRGSGGGSRGSNAEIGGTGGPGGNPGGPGHQQAGGGGGGAGGVGGSPKSANSGGHGGAGSPFPGFASSLFPFMPGAWSLGVGPTGLYAGGGGGGGNVGPNSLGGGGVGGGGYPLAGAGDGNVQDNPGGTAVSNTGSGGGGGGGDSGAPGGAGGSGIVIIRYLA